MSRDINSLERRELGSPSLLASLRSLAKINICVVKVKLNGKNLSVRGHLFDRGRHIPQTLQEQRELADPLDHPLLFSDKLIKISRGKISAHLRLNVSDAGPLREQLLLHNEV